VSTVSEYAIIDPSAEIASDVVVGPWSKIGPNVKISSGTTIGSHVVIKENTVLGKNNVIHPFSSLGGDPQTKDYKHDQTFLEIGDSNVIHEYVTINRGDVCGNGITKIGGNNLFMAGVHVAHDCVVNNDCIFVNNAAIAGHVEVKNHAVLGAYCAVHQMCKIGSHSFLGRGAMVSQDVMPYTMVVGNPPSVNGINKIGLSRRGFSKESINEIMQCYKIIFRSNMTTAEAIDEINSVFPSCDDHVQIIIDMISSSARGVVR
jgi:UDP-N-acetylglucosamine acyltransferase